jgi:hypothetical protein
MKIVTLRPKKYRAGGTKRITVAQAINVKAAVRHAELIGPPVPQRLIGLSTLSSL